MADDMADGGDIEAAGVGIVADAVVVVIVESNANRALLRCITRPNRSCIAISNRPTSS